ncbi:MAG: hypothetical protein NVS2B12_35980 [Ktedonobacteraceae bacterium]
MNQDTQLAAQIAPYQPWLIIAGVFVLFIALRITRRALRRRVEEVGYWLFKERGRFIWFWLNAPGVMLHELSHAFVILLFSPFGFHITNISFFHIQPAVYRTPSRNIMRRGGPQSLQLGEVQYSRPQGRVMSLMGDGLSGIAPLFGGTAAFVFLYWVATGYNLWDVSFDTLHQQFQVIRPGWPWWTLLFAPYLILTVTSELWPSSQDWHGARLLVRTSLVLIAMFLGALWYFHRLADLLPMVLQISSHIDFALAALLALDLAFLVLAEVLVRISRP